jgi:hypothetical protein
MQRFIISAWVLLFFVLAVAAVAHAQDSHPIYDNAPIAGEGSHPNYDIAPSGSSSPIYDSTLPVKAPVPTADIGASINNLELVRQSLLKAPPDPKGRKTRAMADVNAAIAELKDMQYIQSLNP